MAKLIDYAALTVATFIMTFVWAAYLFKGYVGALIFSSALTFAIVVTVRYVKAKTGKPYSYDRLALEFSVKGDEYVIELIKSILKNDEIESGKNYILLENGILISAFRFSNLNISDMGAMTKLARKHGKTQIYAICRGVDRRAYSILQLENVRLTPIKIKTIYKFLKKHDALPDLKPVRAKFSLKNFFAAVLSRSNFKAYAFSGAVLLLTSFLTPLRIYYMVVGSLLLLLAILTLTPLGNGSLFSPKALADLESALSRDNQMTIDELLSNADGDGIDSNENKHDENG